MAAIHRVVRRGRAVRAPLLDLAKFMKRPEQKSLDCGLIAAELAERLSVFCIGIEGAPKTKLRSIALRLGAPELFHCSVV